MSAHRTTLRCSVAYASPQGQFLFNLELPLGASVAQALAAARTVADARGLAALIPWESTRVGIFGEPCGRDARPREGDRIEIYAPLPEDPKQARRKRARARPRGGRSR